MNRIHVALAAMYIVASPLVPASAPAVAGTSPAADTPSPLVMAKADDADASDSDADKRAKAVECSKQADAKKLHGEARKKFRSACKRGK